MPDDGDPILKAWQAWCAEPLPERQVENGYRDRADWATEIPYAAFRAGVEWARSQPKE